MIVSSWRLLSLPFLAVNLSSSQVSRVRLPGSHRAQADRSTVGPITVFNKTIFDIFEGKAGAPNYLHFMGWTYLWAAIFHWVAALSNGSWLDYDQNTRLNPA